MAASPLPSVSLSCHVAPRLGASVVREHHADPALNALVRCAQAGDTHAFRQVAERFEPQLLRFVKRYLPSDPSSAQDVVQDTLLCAWSELERVQGGDHIRPWLFTVARNKAVSHLRRRRVLGRGMRTLDHDTLWNPGMSDPSAPQEPSLDPHAIGEADGRTHTDDLLEALRSAIERLPATYQGAIRLYHLRGCTVGETAATLGIGVSNTKMRLFRGRRRLRTLLREEVDARGPRVCRELQVFLAALSRSQPSPTTTSAPAANGRAAKESHAPHRP